ncbi:gluconokinase [Janibacter melonis]|uniref:gluconokinase n=1 Tax=Janibacter melonis TaxID=262209 RepID=UPI002043DB48|nr:gluconokinase [Janibacter melonis]MCM3554448.1 gluconokinase [Janibacter melonis]
MSTDAQPIRHVVVMGVSGAGKTTLAEGVVAATGWAFLEGDRLHPEANIAKMAEGHPLTDEDRWPWLRAIGEWVSDREAKGESAVIACSALKRSYRDLLREGREHVEFFLLDVPEEELYRRLETREGHYMKASMLRSQLDTLEPFGADEPARTLRSDGDEDEALRETLELLGLPEQPAHTGSR